ncbi:MAG: hypothetical protein ABEH78_05645 [Haloferacaceae archaeon]
MFLEWVGTWAWPVLTTSEDLVQQFLHHGPEVLLLFELGLLVEHLRLLQDVSDTLHDRSP